jgi:hypothetical protein
MNNYKSNNNLPVMKYRFITTLLAVVLLMTHSYAQKKAPPPPPPPPKAEKKAAKKADYNYNADYGIENKSSSAPVKAKKLVSPKEWRQVLKNNIFINADSVTTLYQSLVSKKNEVQKNIENESKKLMSTFIKKSFETSYDFEQRKRTSLLDFKTKMDATINPILEEIHKFDGSVYLSKGNRFKVVFSDKDYDADAQLWKFKIVDIINNNINFIYIKIKPTDAEDLWNSRDKIDLKQVIDFANPNSLLVWLTYPDQESFTPLIFAYTVKSDEEEYVNGGKAYEDTESNVVKVPVENETTSSNADDEETDKIFTSVQIQSTFPGGQGAWVRFLERTMNRDLPIENGAPAGRYSVTVSFVVSRDGSISDVKAENDPGYGTAAEAVRVIKKGPKWTPAEQNGKKVIYRHRQAIVFMVTED